MPEQYAGAAAGRQDKSCVSHVAKPGAVARLRSLGAMGRSAAVRERLYEVQIVEEVDDVIVVEVGVGGAGGEVGAAGVVRVGGPGPVPAVLSACPGGALFGQSGADLPQEMGQLPVDIRQKSMSLRQFELH